MRVSRLSPLLPIILLSACSATSAAHNEPIPVEETEPQLIAQPAEPEDTEPQGDPEDGRPLNLVIDPECTLGSHCNPIPIELFPFTDARDTRHAPQDDFTSYACAPDSVEGGGEWIYTVDIPEVGLIAATIDDASGDETDIDIHLLSAVDPNSCITRHNRALASIVEPGRYFIVADTFTNAEGVHQAGAFQLNVSWLPLGTGNCAMQTYDMKMFWSECAPGISCYEDEDLTTGKRYRYLRTPATGPVVKEAHLVTEAETFPKGWPKSFHDGIKEHYALSQTATGFEDERNQPWAPAGEGGSRFGQGSTGGPIPVLDEAWYITMYWRDRPPKGTRMIVMNVETGRAVVASAGYETGPGANTMIAGVVEEIHHHLGTAHGDQLLVGFALDQELPLGPISCE